MSAAKHTKGPWRVEGELRRRVIKNAKGATVVVIEHWTAEADAQLIAAAPDLLAALIGMLSEDDGGMAATSARAAIAKAEGRS